VICVGGDAAVRLEQLLGVVPGAAGVGHEDRDREAGDRPPASMPSTPATPSSRPTTMGAVMASRAGRTISRCAPAVEMDTQVA
jgi:hypothetical protein